MSEVEDDVWQLDPKRTKTATAHRVPLSGEAQRTIDQRLDFGAGDLLFSTPSGKAMSDATMSKLMHREGFAKRLDVTLNDLHVETRVVWDWQKAGRVYETAPHSLVIDVLIDSPKAFEDTVALVKAAQKGCFLEQTLGQQNTIRHRVLRGEDYVEIGRA